MTDGLLHEIHLAEVIQLISLSEITGDLELTPLYPMSQRQLAMPIGHIYFINGRIHAAFVADRMGEAAVENLFLWEAGHFAFSPLTPADLPPPNIAGDTQMLILRGIERLDRWNSAREMIPSLRIVLHRASPVSSATPPDFHTPEAQLLGACDGKTQLTDLGSQLGLGGLRCREAAANVLSDGFAVATPPSAGEKLVRAIVVAALPTLGVAAELFCDDALRAVGIEPEQLVDVTTLSVSVVTRIVQEIEREVARLLGTQRAAALTDRLGMTLGVDMHNGGAAVTYYVR